MVAYRTGMRRGMPNPSNRLMDYMALSMGFGPLVAGLILYWKNNKFEETKR